MEELKPKLLWIDDEAKKHYEVLWNFLDPLFEIKLCENGHDGLNTAEQWQPDFILLDYQMSPMDGISVLKALKSNYRLHTIPVIMFSQFGADEDAIREGLDNGAIHFIAKSDTGPIIRSRLANIVRNYYQQIGTNQVFISYSRANEEFARKVKDAIQSAGLSTFFDNESILIGDNWERVIEKGIDKCSAMVLILSPDSVKSTNVQMEYSYFLSEQEKRSKKFSNWQTNFFPIKYQECKLPARLELYNYMSCLDKDAEQCITDLVEKLVSALTPSNASIDQTLTRYFELVDQRVFGKFNEIFHSDIVYERPGYPIMEGLSNLIDFYENTREIASGQHMIENKLIQGNKCVCWGRVEGKKRDESIINERFIDVFYFKGNQIIKRTTYFYKEAI